MAGRSDSRRSSDAGVRRGWKRLGLSATVTLAVVCGVVATPTIAAAATGVSNVTVGVAPPTSAAGGLTTYTVSFTTSSAGALVGNDTVTIALPANTGLGSFNNSGTSTLDVGGSQIGYCDATDTSTSTPTVTCYVYGGDTAGASTAVTATLTGVTNPAAGSPTLAVSTTADVTPVTSPAYTVTPARSVSGVSVDITPPTSAAGGLTNYVVSFTTSSTGALDGDAGSTVTIALPANTGLDSFNDGYYYYWGYSPLDVGSTQVGYCAATDTSATTPTVTCYVDASDTVAASTAVTATLTGVTNPPAGSPALAVSTTSDLTPKTSTSYTVTADRSVSGVSVSITPPTSATGGQTTYVVSFTTSSTGELDGTAGSAVTIALPANTGLTAVNVSDYSTLDVGGSTVGYCDATDTSASTPTVTCYLSGGDTIGASTAVTATLVGVTNPPAGSPTLAVSTTSDLTPKTSPAYTVTAARSVSAVSVDITDPTSAAGGLTDYVVSFTTSSTGALDGEAGSTVTIALPANTGLNSLNDYYYYSTLAVGGSPIGYCSATDTSAATPTVTCYVDAGDTVGASTAVTATLTGVTNPPAGSPTLAVSTSSDLTAKTSPGYTVTAPHSVSALTVGVSPPTSATGALTTYAVSFTTSSTGALDGTAGSTVTIALPANTGLGSFNNGSYSTLEVGGSQIGYCQATDTSSSTPTVTCYLYYGDTAGASTTVTATLTGVTNPPAGSPTLAVSTTSDLTPKTSPSYTVTPAQSVSGVSAAISPPTSAAGGLTTYAVSFTTSSTGALDGYAGSTVTIALPANTGLGSFNNGSYSSLDAGGSQIGYCQGTDTSTATPTVTCYVYAGDTVAASTLVTATLTGVTNPPAGSPTLAVSTTSDVTPSTSPSYTITPAQPVSGVSVGVSPPTSAAGGLTTYGVSFTTSSTGGLDGYAGSTVTIALPANTGLDSFNNGSDSSLDAGGNQVGNCEATDASTTTPTVTCYVYGGDTVAASTAVTATLTGVTNPPTGSPTLAVSTTSDVTPKTSPTYTVTAARSVSQPAVSLSNPVELNTSTYQITFTTSATGAMSSEDGSAVTIAYPSGTDTSGTSGTLDVGATQVGTCSEQTSSTTVTCPVQSGTVAAGATVTATVTGVTNPGAGFDTLSVSTTSDTTPVASTSYDLEAQVAASDSCTVPGLGTVSFPTVVSASTAPAASVDEGGTFPTTLGSELTIPSSVINHFRSLGATSLTVSSQTTKESALTSGGAPSGAVSPNTESSSATNLPVSDTLAANTAYTYVTTYTPVTWQSGPGSGLVDFNPGTITSVVTLVGSGTPTILTITCTPPNGVADLGSTTVNPPSATPTLQVPPTPALQSQMSAGTDGGWGATIANTSTATVTGLSATVHLSDGGATLTYDLSGMTASGTNCSSSGAGKISCSLGTLASETTDTLDVLVNTTGLAQGTTISGSATVTSSNASSQTSTFGPLKIVVIQGGNGTAAVAAPGIALASTKAALATAKASVTVTLPTTKIKKADRAEQLVYGASAGSTLVPPPPVPVTLESLAASKEPALCPPTGSLKCEGNIVQAVGNFAAYTNKQDPIVAVLKFFYGLKVPAGTVYMLESNGKSVVKLAACKKAASGYNTPCVSGKEVIGGAASHDSLYAQDTVYFTGTDPAMGRR